MQRRVDAESSAVCYQVSCTIMEDAMTKRDKSDRRNLTGKRQSKRLGTSVLVAAASLLGTSLGVAAATPTVPAGKDAQSSADPKPVGSATVKQENLLAANSPSVQPPHVTVAPKGTSVRPGFTFTGRKTPYSIQKKY